ncbi:uncharacterized protein LOC129907625 isoform X2 [Episyrphus balteatus]|uniref:uncharacterized protein LOC129907625 isoform X2 n=1 Tax=Episyrphus balteatus TaxID=286459 RepID=UPI0024856821|nr:uncharacterized protein LOC129907625 isoform X2 [Episyrphus balteatus]
MESKRKRSENWDSSDKTLLKQLIEEKIAIIEDKCVDTNTSKKKREAWQEILSSFNKCSSSVRDVAQIQCQWRNTKMQAKKRCSNYKRERGATGGGPPPAPPDHEDDHLMSLIPDEFAVDHNNFDCDGKENNDSFAEIAEDIEFILEDINEINPADKPKAPEIQTKNSSDGIKTSTKFKRTRSKKTENSMVHF